MAVVAALFDIWRVIGVLGFTLLFFPFEFPLSQSGFFVIILAVLLRRRHARNPVKNSTGDLMHGQGVTTAQSEGGCDY